MASATHHQFIVFRSSTSCANRKLRNVQARNASVTMLMAAMRMTRNRVFEEASSPKPHFIAVSILSNLGEAKAYATACEDRCDFAHHLKRPGAAGGHDCDGGVRRV